MKKFLQMQDLPFIENPNKDLFYKYLSQNSVKFIQKLLNNQCIL